MKNFTFQLLGIIIGLFISIQFGIIGCDNPTTSGNKDSDVVTVREKNSTLILNIELEVCGVSYPIDDNFNGFIFEKSENPEFPYFITVYHNYENSSYYAKSFYIERVK